MRNAVDLLVTRYLPQHLVPHPVPGPPSTLHASVICLLISNLKTLITTQHVTCIPCHVT